MLIVSVRGQFALDRLRKNFLSEIRGAAMQACGSRMDVQLCLDEPAAQQVPLPLMDKDASGQDVEASDQDQESQASTAARQSKTQPRSKPGPSSRSGGRGAGSNRRGSTKSFSQLMVDGSDNVGRPVGRPARRSSARSAADDRSCESPALSQPSLPEIDSESTSESNRGQGVAGSRAGSGNQSVDDSDRGSEVVDSSKSKMTSANFIPGQCNRLAHTAMVMACQDPASASPLFLCGPTGTGKTHLLAAIAEQLRRRHRMKRVIHLSAEQFTNDFISSVGNSGITAFRRRYREVDALLIDDVQFLGSKKATLREMLYTVETLAGAGRPLVFSGSHSPTEIDGLTRELAGRMAAGLVCSIQPLDGATRETLLQRWIAERCQLQVPDSLIEAINPMLAGDGRVISGIVNVINTLQRMFGRTPTLDELRQYAGQLLRAAKPVTTLSVIESAVCEAFQLPSDSLRGKSQTRAVTGPRMLAMYLSRQLTSAAYAEIARHFGGRSHSTAISAEQNVKAWLAEGGDVGRGRAAMSAREAIDRVETLLRSG